MNFYRIYDVYADQHSSLNAFIHQYVPKYENQLKIELVNDDDLPINSAPQRYVDLLTASGEPAVSEVEMKRIIEDLRNRPEIEVMITRIEFDESRLDASDFGTIEENVNEFEVYDSSKDSVQSQSSQVDESQFAPVNESGTPSFDYNDFDLSSLDEMNRQMNNDSHEDASPHQYVSASYQSELSKMLDEIIPTQETIQNELNPFLSNVHAETPLATVLKSQYEISLQQMYFTCQQAFSGLRQGDLNHELQSFKSRVEANPSNEVLEYQRAYEYHGQLNQSIKDQAKAIKQAYIDEMNLWIDEQTSLLKEQYMRDHPDKTEEEVNAFLASRQDEINEAKRRLEQAKNTAARKLLFEFAAGNSNPGLTEALSYVNMKSQYESAARAAIQSIQSQPQPQVVQAPETNQSNATINTTPATTQQTSHDDKYADAEEPRHTSRIPRKARKQEIETTVPDNEIEDTQPMDFDAILTSAEGLAAANDEDLTGVDDVINDDVFTQSIPRPNSQDEPEAKDPTPSVEETQQSIDDISDDFGADSPNLGDTISLDKDEMQEALEKEVKEQSEDVELLEDFDDFDFEADQSDEIKEGQDKTKKEDKPKKKSKTGRKIFAGLLATAVLAGGGFAAKSMIFDNHQSQQPSQSSQSSQKSKSSTSSQSETSSSSKKSKKKSKSDIIEVGSVLNVTAGGKQIEVEVKQMQEDGSVIAEDANGERWQISKEQIEAYKQSLNNQ